jgi:hypothetical protein
MRLSGVVHLGEAAFEIERLRLGGYLALQKANEEIAEAAKDQHGGRIASGIFNALVAGNINIDRKVFDKLPWYDILAAYAQVNTINVIPDKERFPILSGGGGEKQTPWHYPGRSGVQIIHLIANAYHWPRRDIENLWPEEAFAYIQEIIADEWERRSFDWSASPVAYPYDKSSKKNKFAPLPKPAWMAGLSGELHPNKLGRVPKEMIPQGNVIPSPERKKLEQKEWEAKNKKS